MNDPGEIIGPDAWRKKIAALSPQRRILLAERARSAPLFAHAYAFHLNMRFGGMTPRQVAEFANESGLAGLMIHVEDGEDASLGRMPEALLSEFGCEIARLGLELHIETSTTEERGLADAIRIAHATGATSVRCYPRYEGRISEIVSRTIADLKRLPLFDPQEKLRYTLEQHEELKSSELLQIVEEVGNSRLGLLFDFGNMINAYELPLAALSAQSAYIREVHVKDCTLQPDRGGWAHLACVSGEGHLPMRSILAELLLLGEESPQVAAFGLEEEVGYYAPAFRLPTDGADPFVPARTASFTEIGDVDVPQRLREEAAAAHAQVDTVRSMLRDIIQEAERTDP